MNDPLYRKLKEQSWRGKLTPDQEAELQRYLGAHPEAQADWAAEAALNQALFRLEDAPVSSNFTARVRDAVELDERRTLARARSRRRWWPGWISKAALAGLLVSGGLLALYQQKLAARTEMAKSVAAVSNVAVLPRLEWLEDFEAINRLSQAPMVDEELVALLE